MLNAHQLNVFLTAAETLNFTQAAQRLEMSQPSISQHIQALEQHFGVDLFVRSGRRLDLTDAGVALVPLARNFLYLSNHIEETMASIMGEVSGHLFVGCGTSVGRYILPLLLAYFHKTYPHVRATCYATSQTRAIQMLGEGKVHLAVTSSCEHGKDVEYRRLITDEVQLIVPPDHPWAERALIQPEELYDAEFILPDEESEYHAVIREALLTVGLSIYQFKSLMTLGSAEAIALAVQEHLGVGFVSSIIIHRLVKNGVKSIPIHGVHICQDLFLGRLVNRVPTTAQVAFWESLFNQINPILQAFEAQRVTIE